MEKLTPQYHAAGALSFKDRYEALDEVPLLSRSLSDELQTQQSAQSKQSTTGLEEFSNPTSYVKRLYLMNLEHL